MVGGIAYFGQGGATGIWVLQADAYRPISGSLAVYNTGHGSSAHMLPQSCRPSELKRFSEKVFCLLSSSVAY